MFEGSLRRCIVGEANYHGQSLAINRLMNNQSSHANVAKDDVTLRGTMTTEIESSLPPTAVLDLVRSFFLDKDPVANAWIETESESHISFCTFRGHLSIAAFPDPELPSKTKVRVTTLREEGIVPRLVAQITLHSSAA